MQKRHNEIPSRIYVYITGFSDKNQKKKLSAQVNIYNYTFQKTKYNVYFNKEHSPPLGPSCNAF